LPDEIHLATWAEHTSDTVASQLRQAGTKQAMPVQLRQESKMWWCDIHLINMTDVLCSDYV